MALEIDAGADTVSVPGWGVGVVPAGDTAVRATRAVRFVRLFTALSADRVAKCANAESYHAAHPNIPPFAPWPAAAGGAKVRVYPLEVAPTPGRFGSIYRCSTFMINAIERFEGPRDATRMRSEEHTSELQSLMRISYAVFCLKKKKKHKEI